MVLKMYSFETCLSPFKLKYFKTDTWRVSYIVKCGGDIAMTYAKMQHDWSAKADVMDDRDFASFKSYIFGWVPYMVWSLGLHTDRDC